jgi:hypothetical protein
MAHRMKASVSKTLGLKPVDISPAILRRLEKAGLVRPWRATPGSLRVPRGGCVVDKVYATHPRYGGHKLICVGKDQAEIELSAHPDAEDFIMLDPGGHKFKPLYLIVGLGSPAQLSKKARAGALSARDVLALRLRYNDPAVCAFTMLPHSPHCEVTAPGPGLAPVFFVTEPADFEMYAVPLPGHRLELAA